MAHGITNTDTLGFTGSRKNIWHGIGNELPEGLTAVEAFKHEKLDWDTELAPVYAEVKGQRVELPDYRAHMRGDTETMLGLVSKDYKKIENMDTAAFADAVVGAGKGKAKATVSTCASLLGGKRVFAFLELPKDILVVKGDRLKNYLAVTNGHGGFAGFNCYLTNVRGVCQNTLTLSERDLASGMRFHHTGDLDAKLKQAQLVLGFAGDAVSRFEEQAKRMANTDLSVGQVRDFLALAFTATFGKAPDPTKEPEASAKWDVKREDMITDWSERFEGKNQTIAGIQGTAWAALNAYTEWSDHARGGKWMENRAADHRVHSNLFGASDYTKRKVLKQALALSV